MTPILKIPLFPLNVVILPELSLPLHIFEERYKEMIGDCLEEDKEFGIVFMQGKQMRKVGCTAKIVQVLKHYDDDRMDILTVGKERFNILEISEEKAYLESKVELFDDSIEEDSPQTTALKHKGMALLQRLEKTMQLRENLTMLEKLDSRTLSFIFGGSSVITAKEKQELLEIKITSRRVERSVELLQDAIQRARLIDEIKKRSPDENMAHGFSKN